LIDIVIATPMLNGTPLHPSVIAGVAGTGIPWVVRTDKSHGVMREESININRHKLRETLPASTLVVLLDSDVVIPPNGVWTAVNFLQEYGADCVAIDTKGARLTDPGHVRCAFAVIRRDVYERIDFMHEPEYCQCSKIAKVCRPVWHPWLDTHEVTHKQ
jgi:hypothetical protein